VVLGVALRGADLGVDEGGTTLRAELAFAPARTRLAIGGTPVSAATRGHELSWRVTRGGGLTLNVTGALGWVTYVGRIAVH
jgi:hypothetical protein